MTEDEIPSDREYAGYALAQMIEAGEFDSEKVGAKIEEMFNDLHENNDNMLEKFAVSKAIYQMTKATMLEAAQHNGELEETRRIVAGLDPDEHLGLNYEIDKVIDK